MAVAAHLLDRNGSSTSAFDPTALAERLERGEFFWLDLHRPTEPELRAVAELFGFHPLALEDSEDFHQRAKVEEYDDFAFLVVFGWAPDEDGLVEVHCFYSERFLVTVHRDEAPAFADVRPRCEKTLARDSEGIRVLHHVVDGLVDSFFPVLERLSERLDALEDAMLERPSGRELEEILEMRHRLVLLRKAVGPQRDLFGQLASGAVDLPGMSPEAGRYFRDVYDHLFRLAETVDAYRELVTGAIDVYLSTASNRLGVITKQLTLIATIFLPITFITGFFGQNFGWMVSRVDTWPAFLGLGLGLQLATIGILVVYFKRQGWF